MTVCGLGNFIWRGPDFHCLCLNFSFALSGLTRFALAPSACALGWTLAPLRGLLSESQLYFLRLKLLRRKHTPEVKAEEGLGI
jgi:hypothetical protein